MLSRYKVTHDQYNPIHRMLSVGALLTGGVWLIAKRQDRQRGILMIIAALVLLGNILIWTLPVG